MQSETPLFFRPLESAAINWNWRIVPNRSTYPPDIKTKNKKGPSNKVKGLFMCTDSISIYRVSIPFPLICSFTASMGTSSLWRYLRPGPPPQQSFQRPLRSAPHTRHRWRQWQEWTLLPWHVWSAQYQNRYWYRPYQYSSIGSHRNHSWNKKNFHSGKKCSNFGCWVLICSIVSLNTTRNIEWQLFTTQEFY